MNLESSQRSSSASLSGSAASTPTATAEDDVTCPVPGASFGYIESSNRCQRAVSWNATPRGSVYRILSQPNIGACLDVCSYDLRCDAVGYDPTADPCYQFNGLVAGDGVFYSLSTLIATSDLYRR
ncbi:hypothetical protein DOTSEDRAFT_73690 [Dothistroma septosporum NZE10]|uniref:Apple domain-containing protein n=1 Tax=Dothistroma septosporum (strain NZE10 / CBS 128990) TaxID=675120 RepID=N1PGU8_DOTSN|nr:hypothetical protein DOTSEDRAFT_73690 [Dothistroma septosporum NZE10]